VQMQCLRIQRLGRMYAEQRAEYRAQIPSASVGRSVSVPH
jgi:hypothetical protein